MNKSTSLKPFAFLSSSKFQRGQLFGYILLGALIAFEFFNFGSTEFALGDLLGGLRFLGIKWSTILALAFCGIDFAGIARLFTPEQGRDEPAEVWYLFGAWLLAAAMNATLTWWGVSVTMVDNQTFHAVSVVSPAVLTKAVPIFVALMVWLTRVLIIGAFSIAGERIFTVDTKKDTRTSASSSSKPAPKYRPNTQPKYRPATQTFSPAPKKAPYMASQQQAQRSEPSYEPLNEPTYHPVGMSTSQAQLNNEENHQPPWR